MLLQSHYYSQQSYHNDHTTCDCGRTGVEKHTIMMDPVKQCRTCPKCRAESKEIVDAFDLITK